MTGVGDYKCSTLQINMHIIIIQLALDEPIDVIPVHDQADILSSIKYLVESTVVHINHYHLNMNDVTLHHHTSIYSI